MKQGHFFAILVFVALLGCRSTIPRAIPVDTKPLQASVKEVKKRSEAVDVALKKAVDSNDVAISKADAASKALDKVIEVIEAKGDPTEAIETWKRAHYALLEQLLVTRKTLEDTKKEKILQNESITYLEATVDALVAAAIEQAKAIDLMNKELDKMPSLKEKLSFWRWYSFWATLAYALTVALGVIAFIARAWISARLSIIRSALPF